MTSSWPFAVLAFSLQLLLVSCIDDPCFTDAEKAIVKKLQDTEGEFALHKALSSPEFNWRRRVIYAIVKDDPGSLSRLMKYRPALHLGLINGASEDVVAYLLSVYPEVTKMKDGRGNLPLHWATYGKASDGTVAMLLKLNPQGARGTDVVKKTPLHYAAQNNASPNIVALLLEAFPEGAYHREGNTIPLVDAAFSKKASPVVFKLLLDAYPNGIKHVEQLQKDFKSMVLKKVAAGKNAVDLPRKSTKRLAAKAEALLKDGAEFDEKMKAECAAEATKTEL